MLKNVMSKINAFFYFIDEGRLSLLFLIISVNFALAFAEDIHESP